MNPPFFHYLVQQMENQLYPTVEVYTSYTAARNGLQPLRNAKALRPEFGYVYNDINTQSAAQVNQVLGVGHFTISFKLS